MDIKEIPEELLSKRDIIESNYIFSLYIQPEFVDEYKHIKNGEDIITEDGIFYYGLLQQMVKSGFTTITDMSINAYCEDKKTIKDGYIKRGGWSTIQEIINIVSFENIDAYVDELTKMNILIRLHQKGFNVLSDLDKFKQMNSEEVSSYYEYLLADVCIGQIDNIKSENLSTGYEKAIQEWNENPEVGFPVGLPKLNYRLAGIHRKNLTLHLGGIGMGKTTSAVAWYILPAIEAGDNICIIANEQDTTAWRQMILATVLFNKLEKRVKGLDRQKILFGNYTPEQIEIMEEAGRWLEKQPGKITFIDINNYDLSTISRMIKKWSKLGISYFIVDTFKPMDDASERAWGEFSETAKALFLLSKKLDIAIVCTAQLAPSAINRKFLDLTAVGKSRSISETASTVIMFRPLTPQEKQNIEYYKFDKETKQKIYKKIDKPDEDYIMVFTPKNRYGSVSPQLIVQRNMSFNTYRELGYYECPTDY